VYLKWRHPHFLNLRLVSWAEFCDLCEIKNQTRSIIRPRRTVKTYCSRAADMPGADTGCAWLTGRNKTRPCGSWRLKSKSIIIRRSVWAGFTNQSHRQQAGCDNMFLIHTLMENSSKSYNLQGVISSKSTGLVLMLAFHLMEFPDSGTQILYLVAFPKKVPVQMWFFMQRAAAFLD
jgi:hypothetical protein